MAFFTLSIHADNLPSLSFSKDDWEVVCDNTRTCRAVGYESDQNTDFPVAVLLTRRAGPNTPVLGEVMIGDPDEVEDGGKLFKETRLALRINDSLIGYVELKPNETTAAMPPKLVDALLASLTRHSNIVWRNKAASWQLSDKGAAAVLLKMDDFQGRIGTPSALIKKGNEDENKALPPLTVPVVTQIAPSKAPLSKKQLALSTSATLRDAVKATLKNDYDCDALSSEPDKPSEFSITRLNEHKLLASLRCWEGGYNSAGEGYWVINDAAPFEPELITTSASEGDERNGRIFQSMKGRGIGDCWYVEEWTWDGKKFVHTDSYNTGQCKLLAAGGGFKLPTIVTEVRHP